MGQLRDQAEALGIEVDGRWSNGTLERKIRDAEAHRADEAARNESPDKAVMVRLLKNHRPLGWYEIVGHEDEDGERKPGPMPSPQPGVEFPHKLWAGTIVKLEANAARALVENTIVERVIDRDPETREYIRVRNVQRRKPLAEVMIDWVSQPEELVSAEANGG